MSEDLHAQTKQALAAWGTFWRKHTGELRRLQSALNEMPRNRLDPEDVPVIDLLLHDIERLFRRYDYFVQNPPWDTGDAFAVLLARDSMWLSLEIQDVAKSFDRASEQVKRVALSRHLAASAKQTFDIFKTASSLAADILTVAAEPVRDASEKIDELRQMSHELITGLNVSQKSAKDASQKIDELRQINESLAKNQGSRTVKQMAAQLNCSRQAVSKRIRRLIDDGWLPEPPTAGKQRWDAHEVKIILENPRGRPKK